MIGNKMNSLEPSAEEVEELKEILTIAFAAFAMNGIVANSDIRMEGDLPINRPALIAEKAFQIGREMAKLSNIAKIA